MLRKLGSKAERHTSSPLCIFAGRYVGGHDDSVNFVSTFRQRDVVDEERKTDAVPMIKVDAARAAEIEETHDDDADEACAT